MDTPSKKLVAIIDDDNMLCKNLSDFLTNNNYDCVVANNGQIGLELILAKNPDIILLDINMPHVDGIELIKIISKENPIFLNKINIMTNSDNSEYLAEVIELGVHKYFVKSNISLEGILNFIKINN